MSDLRNEIAAAFPVAPVPAAPIVEGRDDEGLEEWLRGRSWRELKAPSLRRRPKALMRLTSPAFRYYVAGWLLASIEDPEDPDILPGVVVAAIAKRGGDARTMTPEQRKVLAKFVALHADDGDLRGGNLLAALGNLSQ
jgi:hypothetical protein